MTFAALASAFLVRLESRLKTREESEISFWKDGKLVARLPLLNSPKLSRRPASKAKGEKEDLSDDQKNKIRELIEALEAEGQRGRSADHQGS
jgi:hypothetical protein